MKQHNMNKPKNDRKIIRKMIMFRIEIWPKEAPPGVESPRLKKIEGGPAPPEYKRCAEAWVSLKAAHIMAR